MTASLASKIRRATLVILAPLALAAGACESGGACAECRDEKCDDLVATCKADEGCGCMADCLGKEGVSGVSSCLGTCGLDARPAAFLPVEECVARACPDDDECSTPSGYEPPMSTTLSTVADERIGGGTLADCGIDASLPFDPDGEVLQLQSPDGRACVRLERRNDGAGSLANTQWTLLDARIGTLGAVSNVSDPSSLCWYSSHHNFGDVAHAWTGARHHDVVLKEDGHGGARTYELHTFEAGPLSGTCEPQPEGTLPVGDPLRLDPVR